MDVQSAKHETTLNNDVLKSIPTVRSYNAMVVVVPGVVTNLNDTVTGTSTTQFPIHGGRNNEGRMTIDGLNVGNPPGGNQPPAYVADVGNAEEVTFSTSGGLGENETGGLTMNVVPKTGGNRISGSVFFSGTNESLMSENFDNIVGLSAPTPFKKIYDLNGSFGGPIKKDKIWYFINARTQGSKRINANQFYNLNAGKADQWLYAADLSRPGFSDRTWENVSGRVTWQANAKNKISGFWDEQATCRKCEGQTSGITDAARLSPEAGSVGATKPLRVMQASWSSPHHQPPAARRRLRRRLLRLGQLRARPQPDARPHARHRAVRGRLRRQRRHRRASSTGRRTSTSTTPARSAGRATSPTSPAATA